MNKRLGLKDDLVPFINRCKVNIYRKQPDLFEYYGSATTKIGYMHVFKSGGSTVIKTWENVREYVGKGLTGKNAPLKVHWRRWEDDIWAMPREYHWIKNNEYFYRNVLENQFLFSFVRDPISRFLSGFFEYTVRASDNVEIDYMNAIEDTDTTPVHLANELAFIMEHRMTCEYKYKYEQDRGYLVNPLNIYWDDHLNPQMHFLLNDEWKTYPFDYVGMIVNMEESVADILSFYNDIKKADFGQFFERQRDRHDKAYQNGDGMNRRTDSYRFEKRNIVISDLVLEPEELNDDLIRLICDLYWLDYLCLPFDIPLQCNITELYLQHYGNHVEYNDCYQ